MILEMDQGGRMSIRRAIDAVQRAGLLASDLECADIEVASTRKRRESLWSAKDHSTKAYPTYSEQMASRIALDQASRYESLYARSQQRRYS